MSDHEFGLPFIYWDTVAVLTAQSEARTLSEPTPATGPAQIERPTEHTSPSEPNVVEVE